MTRQTPGPDQLRLEAARKRQELGDTIEQLVAKTDVKARAARLVHRKTPEPVRDKAVRAARAGRRNAGPLVVAAATVLVAGLLLRHLRNEGKCW
ncbi:DUF3618 domain-containing protein [Streptomyces sp. SP18CS02]|uniref:DUF3618 domain-containing protein n=1 Tax=Streptomyces sp. SP18CS02 TaxID=3002531 RepID=UPI002E7681D7|nr:DUF3618 domain-containing protein [Streptomyces sp. SP18CS02]MEE1754888.1 DUF3618 domain-containing protein [Streptomyces sp. SP18CS02]